MSANRNLYVTLRDAAGNERGLNIDSSGNITVSTTGNVAVTNAALTELAAAIDTELQVDIVASATLPVDITGNGLTSLQLLDDVVFADDAAFTVATSKLHAIGFLADESSTDSVDEGDIGAARMTLDRKVIVSNYAHSAGGASSLKYTSAGSTEDEHAVMTAPGTLYSITVTNTNAAARYLRCENDTAANTTPGSETVELDLAIPGATTGAGFTTTFPVGVNFSTALTCWTVTGAADTDVAEVAANEIKIFYTFKQ
jgi:hypothetical protein